jgi:hypothetical protein
MSAINRLGAFALAIALSITCHAAPSFRLVTNGPTGEFISGGSPQLFVSPAANVKTELLDRAPPLGTDFFRLSVNYGGGTFFRFDVGTDGLAKNLEPGIYPSAERASFATLGNAGLDVAMLGRGCNEVGGSFVIHSIRVNSSQGVDAIDVSFTQLCEGREPALIGRFTYDATGGIINALDPYANEIPQAVPTAEAIGFLIMFFGLLICGLLTIRKST